MKTGTVNSVFVLELNNSAEVQTCSVSWFVEVLLLETCRSVGRAASLTLSLPGSYSTQVYGFFFMGASDY